MSYMYIVILQVLNIYRKILLKKFDLAWDDFLCCVFFFNSYWGTAKSSPRTTKVSCNSATVAFVSVYQLLHLKKEDSRFIEKESFHKLWGFFLLSRSEAAQAAQAAAARINQQLGVGPPSSAPPPAAPKPSSHTGGGMVVTEEYAIPDKMVGLSKSAFVSGTTWT